MSNPGATKGVNEVPTVRTRKQTEKGLTYSLEILFDRRKRLLLRLQRKSENIKNLMENKFNVRPVSEEFKQYYDLLKLFSGVQCEYHGKLDNDQQKADDFWFDEVDQKIFTFKHSVHNYLRENEEVLSRRSGSSRKTKSSSSSSISKSRKSGKSIKEQVINEKMKEALASFRTQQKTKKLTVEEMKLEEELLKAMARVKVTEAQEELEKGKTLSSGLNSGNQIEFTENLSFRGRTANNMQSINQSMNVLQLYNKNSTTVKSSEISETFAKASPSHSAAVHNLYNDNNRFIDARITDNASRTIRSRDDEE